MDTITYLDGDFGVTEKIKKAMYNVCKEYLYIGFLLREVKDYEYYKEKDYTDVYDYARQELGFKKSSVKNFIAISDTFCLVQKGTKTMFLEDKYERFKYSQLCEMLSLSDKQRENVSPDMTVKEIRALKKEMSGQTSGQIVYMGSKPLNVCISSALHDRLAEYSEKSGFSMDLLVDRALAAYLDTVSQINIGGESCG